MFNRDNKARMFKGDTDLYSFEAGYRLPRALDMELLNSCKEAIDTKCHLEELSQNEISVLRKFVKYVCYLENEDLYDYENSDYIVNILFLFQNTSDKDLLFLYYVIHFIMFETLLLNNELDYVSKTIESTFDQVLHDITHVFTHRYLNEHFSDSEEPIVADTLKLFKSY